MRYFKKYLMSGLWIILTLGTLEVHAADSTSVVPLTVLPTTSRGFVLARGEALTKDKLSETQTFILTIPNVRCPHGTSPFIEMAPQRSVFLGGSRVIGELDVYPYDFAHHKDYLMYEANNGSFVDEDSATTGYVVHYRAAALVLEIGGDPDPIWRSLVSVTWTLYCIPIP